MEMCLAGAETARVHTVASTAAVSGHVISGGTSGHGISGRLPRLRLAGEV